MIRAPQADVATTDAREAADPLRSAGVSPDAVPGVDGAASTRNAERSAGLDDASTLHRLDGLEFARPEGALWLSIAIPAAIAAVALVLWRRRARTRLAEPALLARIAPSIAAHRDGLRASLLVVALAALCVALLDPRAGGRVEEVEQTGIDVMFVVDVSRSMLAADATPDRLARARQFAGDLVDALGSDRVGLVEFAGVPALRCPLTFNHRTFLTQLDTLSPQATVRGGSMLGDAIRLAAASLDAEGVGKAIVVLSDGEDMQSEPVEAAAVAAKEGGIRVVTIGLGDAREGARIPIATSSGRRYLVHEGQEVWTRMDPALLRQVADAGDGFFVEAGTGQADMRQVADLLRAGLESRTREARDVVVKEPLFQWLAGLALVLATLECVLGPWRANERGVKMHGLRAARATSDRPAIDGSTMEAPR